jgi:uncharacterized membrane protein YedE/YeeE
VSGASRQLATALLCGLIFGVGLCVSGMTDPKNVIAFLDVAGKWSPNLGGVMLGAIAVHAGWLWFGGRLERTAKPDVESDAATTTSLRPLASGKRVDAALVGGAALFGIGWGFAGYCPGPALVALGSGASGVALFVAAMGLGMALNVAAGAAVCSRSNTSALSRDEQVRP